MGRTEWREFRMKLKEDWKAMWRERIDDEVRAEGIARRDYEDLSIERGTVLYGSRGAGIPSFNEILERAAPPDFKHTLQLDPRVGGWRKFARTALRRTR